MLVLSSGARASSGVKGVWASLVCPRVAWDMDAVIAYIYVLGPDSEAGTVTAADGRICEWGC